MLLVLTLLAKSQPLLGQGTEGGLESIANDEVRCASVCREVSWCQVIPNLPAYQCSEGT